MSLNGISALERGYRQTPHRETVALLAKALRLDAQQRQVFEAAAVRSAGLRPGDGRASVTSAHTFDQSRARPNSNLSLSLTTFIGRETELREIIALVREQRLVTLTGAGGVGKTRIAVEMGAQMPDVWTDGVWLASLAPLHDATLVATTIAQVLQVEDAPQKPIVDALVAFLRSKTLVLVLDNCEHVIDQAALVANALLRGCPRLRIVATSREPLRVAGEYIYRMPSLEIPLADATGRLVAAEAAKYDAVVLFAERARAVDRRFVLTDENAPIVAEICRRLDGIPLAIELAAARVSVLSVKALLEKLDRRLAILTAGDRAALARHQTMRALIDWSYDLLSPSEQRLFERLSVFAGGCTLAAVIKVCGHDGAEEDDFLQLLGSLVDKSLVVADVCADEPRYLMLESLREYAAEKLAARGAQRVIAARHARAYYELAVRLEGGLDTAPDPELLSLIRELENWRSALEWTLGARADVALGQRLVGVLRPLWVNVAFAHIAAEEGQRWVETALEMVDDSTPPEIIARLEHAAAAIAARLRAAQQALTSSERALGLYRRMRDPRGIAGALLIVGRSLLWLGRSAEAETILREGLTVARSLGTHRLAGLLLESLALASSHAGQFGDARAYSAEALAIYRAIGEELLAAIALANLAEMEFRRGHVQAALRLAEDGLRAYLNLTSDFQVNALAKLAAYLIAAARHEEAYRRAREAVELGREHQHHVAVTWGLQHLAAIATLRPCEDVENLRSNRERAARLVGFVDARLAILGAPRQYTEQHEYERAMSVLRTAFDRDELDALIRTGASMTGDQAIGEALV